MAADISKHLDRAKRFLEKNRVEDAIEAYLAVIDAAPQHQEATQALGDLYARMEEIARILTARSRGKAGATAPARGLFLTGRGAD